MRFDELEIEMRNCYQSAGQNMLEHGQAVSAKFGELLAHLQGHTSLTAQWRLPTWLDAEAGALLLTKMPNLDLVPQYQLYHDCGKPRCRTVDADGRQHFPDHAAVSQQVWLEHGGDVETGALIAMDMDVHLLKAEAIPEFASRPQAATLLLTALAEIHANAPLFGGTDSTSFKIKLKHIERRGKQIIQHLRENS